MSLINYPILTPQFTPVGLQRIVSRWRSEAMSVTGMSSFLQELESYCFSVAIVTFLDSNSEPMVMTLTRQGQQVTYGDDWGIKELFISKLLWDCNPSGSLILRSFTEEIDEFTQLPIKELRGYILQGDGDDLA